MGYPWWQPQPWGSLWSFSSRAFTKTEEVPEEAQWSFSVFFWGPEVRGDSITPPPFDAFVYLNEFDICIYIYTHTDTYYVMYIFIYVLMCIYVYIYMYTYICIHIYTSVHIYIYMYIHMYEFSRLFVYLSIHAYFDYVYIYIQHICACSMPTLRTWLADLNADHGQGFCHSGIHLKEKNGWSIRCFGIHLIHLS